jgi:hypothetical protein
MMADRPILFSAPMVQALLAGRKTQTRRILKPQPPRFQHYGRDIMDWGLSGIYQEDDQEGTSKWMLDVQTDVDDNSHEVIDVRFAKGDRLYVRETWSADRLMSGFKPRDMLTSTPIWYWADGNPHDGDWIKPKPGIHMPRWASRLTLTVTDVRVERLHQIVPADAIAEGIFAPANSQTIDCATRDPRDDYRALWNNINGANAWDANPWVVAVSFTVERKNIDA